MEATGNRVDAGKVIGQTFDTYGKYVGPLLGGAVIVVGIAAIISGLLSSSGSLILSLVGTIVTLAAQALYTGYVVKLVQDVRDGRMDSSVGELFSAAAPYIGTLILNGILAGIAIVFGFVLLIVPGLILITIWAVISPSIVVENKGVMEAFGRSRELVKGEGWTVFATILLALVILIVVGFVLGLIGAAVGDDAGRVIVSAIGSILTAPIAALVASILFFDLGGGSDVPAAPAAPAAPTY